jgi:Ca2+-binding EF-hand superfamily protein
MAELQAVCTGQFFQTCMDFLASSENAPECEPVFLGPDIGFMSVFEYSDEDNGCKLSIQELSSVCSKFFQECLDFLASSEQAPTCEPVFLGPDVGYVNVFEYNDEDNSCKLSLTELAEVCKQFFDECISFLESSEEPPTCEEVFLGADLGYVSVMEYHDEDGTCKISMAELGLVCKEHFSECLSFLASSEQHPVCEDIFLGADIGFASVFEYHDEDGTCKLSMEELGRVCAGIYFQACIDFLASSEQHPVCDTVFLGPDIGYASVFEYNDEDGTCKLSIQELAAVCAGQFYQTCIDFLASSEQHPQCDSVFLGPDIGNVNIFEYNDADGTCDLSMAELGEVCKDYFFECIDFLESSEHETPQCDPVFLGPDVGLVNIFNYHDEDGTCRLSMQELAAVCTEYFSECLSFLESSEHELPDCEQVYLGADIGFQNIMTYNDEDGSCKINMAELQAVCTGQFFQLCMDFLASSEEMPHCERVYLGPDIGFAAIMTFHDEDESCEIDMGELAKICSQFFQECIEFLESSEGMAPRCDKVFLGPDIGYVNIMTYHDDDDSCTLSMPELAAVCTGELFAKCISFLDSSESHEAPKCEPIFLGPDIGLVSVFSYHDEDASCKLSMAELATVCAQYFAAPLVRTRSPGCRVREQWDWGRTGPWQHCTPTWSRRQHMERIEAPPTLMGTGLTISRYPDTPLAPR